MTQRLACAALLAAAAMTAHAADDPRPRVVVMTDIGGDPDDEQSIVRYLLYACDVRTEGLLTGFGHGHYKNTRPDLLRKAVAAYGQVAANLRLHRGDYPAAEELMALIKDGHNGDPHAVGEGMDSEASDWIIRVLDRPDPRPVWFTIWGGPRELAQALWKLSRMRTPEELAALKRKVRVHSIADQDRTAPWVKANHPDVFWIYSRCFRGIWQGEPAGPCSPEWLKANVLDGHGPLGAVYPPKAAGKDGVKEGDTPSFFHVLPVGLSDPNRPEWGGWGGRFQPSGRGCEYVEAPDDRDGKGDAQWTIARWRQAYQNAFEARMDWCVRPAKEANHEPAAVCNGQGGTGVLTIDVKPGTEVKLSAAGSTDPDGGKLSYRWWVYREAGTYEGDAAIAGADAPEATVTVPADAAGTIHVVLEVTDDGKPPLTSYRRAVLTAPAAAAVEFRPAPDGPWTFWRAVNLNGKAAQIDGQRWDGDDAADFACTDKPIVAAEVQPQPATDAARTAMLTSFRFSRTARVAFRNVPEGAYAVFAYVFEDNNPETVTFALEGRIMQRGYNTGPAGTWRRLGPWIARITDGTIDLTTQGGAANISGVEVWKLADPRQ